MPLQKYTKDLFQAYGSVLSKIEQDAILGFERLFREHPPSAGAPAYQCVEITCKESFDAIWRGKGMYMIASDFEPDLELREACSLTIDGLPVIYRGQADLVRERVRSHLDNTRYQQMKREKHEGIWTRCLKLDRNPGNGGIDFDIEPYQKCRWIVLVLPLRDSSTKFRHCAEWGFDMVFGKPIASNEKAQGPNRSLLEAARVRRVPEVTP